MKSYLFVSSLLSERLLSAVFRKTRLNPGFAVQKFCRLLVKGLTINGVNVVALTTPPITRQYSECLFVNLKNETENSIKYCYMPFVDLPILKHLFIFIYSFFYVFYWNLNNRGDKAIICDVLCISSSMGILLASKLCGLKSVAVVTDLYDQMVGTKSSGVGLFLSRLAGILNKKYVQAFNQYVLLTEAMNEVVNPNGRPYIIMEALCDAELSEKHFPISQKNNPKVLMYAGGLEKRYGLKLLVMAFKSLPHQDIQLHLYGDGSYVGELIEEIKTDERIKYFGVVPNDEIIKAEYEATILINPRFTTEEFTKYSFPSKNMEYMVSGTPLLTTRLPGMPKEYYPHVYIIEDETLDGYIQAISNVLNITDEELNYIGIGARQFVLKKKNNIFQAKRVIELINSSGC